MAGNANAHDLIRNQARFSYIVLCYSIDSRKSFTNLDEWLEAINENPRGKSKPIALVATKEDLKRDREVNIALGNQKKQ